jgi:hypothetical protein
MKRIVLFLALVGALATKSFAQCSETNQPKVLLIGDSWAAFMNTDQTFNNAFKNWGHSNYKFVSNSIVSENGAETDDFQKVSKQNEIVNLINANPSIEVIHLSIGGNDVLGDWKVSFTPGQTDTLLQQVSERLDSVIRFLKSTKPGIKVLWSGYTYPNFAEVVAMPGFLSGSQHPFYGTWDNMEQPTFTELNTMLNRFSDSVTAYAALDPQVDFVKATGLMQYTFGQAAPLGIAPGGTYPAFSVPLPEGDPTYPSPKQSMRDYFGVTLDCFHLSPKGYLDLIEYHTQKYYHKLLMDDLYLLSENSNTGGVSSAATATSTLSIGGSSTEFFGTHLSFNTTTMADTTLAKASIFLRREALTGSNPLNGTIDVKVKSGNFGASAAVEASDYAAAGDGTGNPCVFGNSANNVNWVRFDLPASLYPFINKNNNTQFIITSPGFSTGEMSFSGAGNPDYAPVLNLKYGSPSVSVKEVENSIKFSVFPNPVKDQLQIEGVYGDILRLQVVNIFGQQIGVNLLNERSISTENLPSGNYFISITTKEGSATQRFIKE